MSVEEAIRFLEQAAEGNEIEETSVEDLIQRAGTAGFDVTLEDLGAATEQLIGQLKESGGLSDDELDAISVEGGMASGAFQNFDQKANQLYNLLSSVMKAMNEMRMGTVRNML